ncbi:MAG: TonB family protein [Pseudoxanthomonas sp.]
MVRSLPWGSSPRLDAGRILAYAAVAAVHVLAFLLLLMPMAAQPPQATLPDESKPPVWLKKIEVERPPVPDPVPIARPQPRAPQVDRIAVPTTPTPAVDNGSIAVEPTVEGNAPADIAPVAGPVSVNQLAYLRATPPPYPRAEQSAGIGGTVLLRILVDVDGAPLEAVVEQSSGNRNLDRAAQRHVLKTWRFQPAMRDGHAVQAYGLVPIVFSVQ